MDRNPPILNHNSRGRSTSSCNCGRKQAPREDPFDIQAANYDFYQVRIHTSLPTCITQAALMFGATLLLLWCLCTHVLEISCQSNWPVLYFLLILN